MRCNKDIRLAEGAKNLFQFARLTFKCNYFYSRTTWFWDQISLQQICLMKSNLVTQPEETKHTFRRWGKTKRKWMKYKFYLFHKTAVKNLHFYLSRTEVSAREFRIIKIRCRPSEHTCLAELQISSFVRLELLSSLGTFKTIRRMTLNLWGSNTLRDTQLNFCSVSRFVSARCFTFING